MALQTILSHDKFRALVATLDISRPLALGHLEMLWLSVYQRKDIWPDGRLPTFSARRIASVAEWGGDPDAFVDALVRAQFLDVCADGVFALHNCAKRAPDFRKRYWRNHPDDAANAVRGRKMSDTIRQMSETVGKCPDREERRGEERRREEKKRREEAEPPSSKSKTKTKRPRKPSPSARIKFDARTGDLVGIDDTDIARWTAEFPSVDVAREIRMAALWLVDHPDRRKKNYASYLTRWMRRQQDDAPKKTTEPGRTKAAPGKYDNVGDNTNLFACPAEDETCDGQAGPKEGARDPPS